MHDIYEFGGTHFQISMWNLSVNFFLFFVCSVFLNFNPGVRHEFGRNQDFLPLRKFFVRLFPSLPSRCQFLLDIFKSRRSDLFRLKPNISLWRSDFRKEQFSKKNCVQGVLRLKLIVKYWLFSIKNWFAYSWQPTFCSVKIYFYEKKYLCSRNIYICTIGFFSHCYVLGDRRRLFQCWNGWTLL